MAQNITLMGASYSDVPAVNLPKTGGGTARFTDVTDTTASASDVAQGKYFYDSSGARTVGTSSGGDSDYFVITMSEDQNGAWNPDCTFAEIHAAYTAGKEIVVVSDPSGTRAEVSGYYNASYGGDTFYISVNVQESEWDEQYNEYVFIKSKYYSYTTNGYTETYSGNSYDTENGTATASDVANGKLFWSNGGRMVGTASGGGSMGTKTITANGTYNASADNLDGYSSVTVNVPTSGASNIAQGTFTTLSSAGVQTINTGYTGNGYPILVAVWVHGGVYNSDAGSDTNAGKWHSTVSRYAIRDYYAAKANSTTPTYDGSGSEDIASMVVEYKSSTSSATAITRTGSNSYIYVNGSASAMSNNVLCIKNKNTLSIYVQNTSYGFLKDLIYDYIVVYSE